MKRYSIMAMCLFAITSGFAQITSAEYFFDTDPGVGNGTALTISGNTIDQNLNIPTTGVIVGRSCTVYPSFKK